MAAKIKILEVGPLDVNCYIVWDEDTGEAVIIDPGGDAPVIEREVRAEGLKVRYILNTHGHFDHVGADGETKKRFNAPLAIHRDDADLLEKAPAHAGLFGLRAEAQPAPDFFLEDNAVIEAGPLRIEVLHTPGHTPGGVCLYIRAEGVLFSGDTLFAGSVGRTDLEGGSTETLLHSIRTRLLTLDDSVRVYPGHGPSTTIGDERRHNPYLGGSAF
jgi:glyoxylase-like metal-dependent hydrolase (beta-lactamase superfamily II)